MIMPNNTYDTHNYIAALEREANTRADVAKAKQLLQDKESTIMLNIAAGNIKAKNAEERKAVVDKEAAEKIQFLNNCESKHRDAVLELKKQEHYFEIFKINSRLQLSDKGVEISKNRLLAATYELDAAKENEK